MDWKQLTAELTPSQWATAGLFVFFASFGLIALVSSVVTHIKGKKKMDAIKKKYKENKHARRTEVRQMMVDGVCDFLFDKLYRKEITPLEHDLWCEHFASRMSFTELLPRRVTDGTELKRCMQARIVHLRATKITIASKIPGDPGISNGPISPLDQFVLANFGNHT